MNNTNTGGPAFPTNEGDTYDGMTLRDYFAAKVLNAALVNATNVHAANQKKLVETCKQVYRIADAMLEARSL